MLKERRNKLVNKLKEKNIDVAIIVPGPNMYYFTGLKLKQSERLALAVLTKEGSLTFVVPQVELSKVEMTTSEKIFFYTDEDGPTQCLLDAKTYLGSINCIGIEFGNMRVMELKASESLTRDNIKFEDISHDISLLRMHKDKEEIEYLQGAVKILEDSLSSTLPYIKPGTSEMDIAAQLEFEMRKRGSEGTPFETIVASGYRGALPHGRASDKTIESGELVVLDFGSIYKGYVGDICRTVAVGGISNELQEIYYIVKEAQKAAVDVIKPEITAHEVDQAARNIIKKRGYGKYFTHRTGHGIGLSGHEEPYMMQMNQLVLKLGMSFTVEPGIYLPEKGGVRIEDNIIVTENGSLNLMSFSKDLIRL